jgi:hypothetical protein
MLKLGLWKEPIPHFGMQPTWPEHLFILNVVVERILVGKLDVTSRVSVCRPPDEIVH